MTKSKSKVEQREGGGATTPPSQSQGSITLATSESPAPEVNPKDKPKELGRSRGFLWTLYQYEPLLEKLRQEAQCAEYAVWGYEVCPDTGRPHLQGYIHYKNQRELGAFSRKFNNCWVKQASGSARENREYCLKIRNEDKKPNEKFEEFGTMPVQGHRADWSAAVQQLQDGATVEEVILDQPHLLPNQRALREFKCMLLKPKHREVNVIVLWGRGGTGKTRWAYEQYPNIFAKPANKTSGSWWDGYSGQKEVLLDDYYGGIAYHEFLTLTDRYPYAAPICGAGYVQAQWDTVVITSNKHPQFWYKNHWGWPLRRRLNKIIEVKVIDGKTHYEEEEFPADEKAWRSQETYALEP